MDFELGPITVAAEQPFSHLVSEHGKRFERIEGDHKDLRERVNELEAQMNQLLPLTERMDTDLYNHGKEGLKTQFDKFTAVQNDRHKENSAKINLVITLLALMCTILLVIIAWKGLAKTSKLVTDPFHSKIPTIVLSSCVKR